jgi:hypothetical protein
MLETMVDKANHIYLRWAAGQDDDSLVLRHRTDQSPEAEGVYVHRPNNAKAYAETFMSEQQPKDSFACAHPNLAQCITEVHQRALTLFPLRKPCQCSARVPTSVPQHKIKLLSSPVLPELFTERIAYGILQTAGPTVGPPKTVILSESRMAVVDTLNFDFGALDPSWNDQSWMAWF